MRTLATYIEYLLMTRHYCYVPGRGAYMIAEEPASLSADSTVGSDDRRLHTVEAPRRIVRFSPLHTHDDGMLANLLMEAEGMSFDEARRYIERQAPLLTDDFIEFATLHTDTDHFGFEPLHLETWTDMEFRLSRMQQSAAESRAASSASKRDDVITIPKYWLKRTAVAAMIAFFFFTNFIGLNRTTANMASVIDVNVIQRNALVHQTWDEEDELADLSEQEAIETIDNPLIEAVAAETLAEQSSQRHPELVATVPVSPVDIYTEEDGILDVAEGTTYFIVGFCTRTESYAYDVLQRYKEYGYKQAGILVTKDLYRVFVAQFSEKEDALAFLFDVRKENVRLSKSWMLPFDNDGSLSSYIIKKTYNDNQLSMELSHPHQRTERDQG